MNLDQIALRISNPNTCLATETPVLQELAEKYPYAQVFSILYLKSLSIQNDIGFDEALQKHAYRITDRMKLYDLIHNQNPATEVQSEPEATVVTAFELNEEILESQELQNFSEPAEAIDVSVEIHASEAVHNSMQDNLQPESTEEVNLIVAEEDDLLKEISSEILFEKGLTNEVIESGKEPAFNPAVDVTESSEIEDEIDSEITHLDQLDEDPMLLEISQEIVEEFHLSSAEIEDKKNSKREEILESNAAENLQQNQILDLDLDIISEIVETIYSDNLEQTIQEVEVVEKKSEINQVEESQAEIEIGNSKMSFTSWLKSGNTSSSTSTTKEINEEQKEVQPIEKQKVDLIENFIKTEPKISKVKKEFYSPSKKAKESISTEGLIYSETLAEIFAMQGNFPKAITAYQQLMLTNPEKKIFFAKRIEELKEKLNT